MTPTSSLVRIAECFEGISDSILESLDAVRIKRLSGEYHLVQREKSGSIRGEETARYVRWSVPVDHSWPCDPAKTKGFVEKAAQAICGRFAGCDLQGVFMGPLDGGSAGRHYKSIASNLRGRTMQLFPPELAARREPETQDPEMPSLFCLLGREGLFCGVTRPREANGFYPGGTKFIRQDSADTISRAGAKVAEALYHLRLHRPLPVAGSHWLELGACPGGMTSELLKRGYRVTAIDRAPLDRRLDGAEGLRFVRSDVATFEAARGTRYDAILCDMNGDSCGAIRQVMRLARHLSPGGLVIFTLKTGGAQSFGEMNELHDRVVGMAKVAGLSRIATTHLTYNRQEFTLFFERPADP